MRYVLAFMVILFCSLSYAETYIVYDSDIEPKTFVIHEGKAKTDTYHIQGEISGKEMLREVHSKSMEKRKFWIRLFHDQDKLERCLRERTKNWKRTIGGKTIHTEGKCGKKDLVTHIDLPGRDIFGYDEKEDYRMKWRMWKNVRKKGVC